jgi:hypothetical protein
VTAVDVFHQQNGDVTRAYYQRLTDLGPLGHIAVCLFRAQKRSSRAKDYRRGCYRSSSYDVKAWSMKELCVALSKRSDFTWGWKQDSAVKFDDSASWVLYVDLPGFGQVSFHSPDRCGCGPDYPGEWDGQHLSKDRIIAFCDHVETAAAVISP